MGSNNDINESEGVEERLNALEPGNEFQPDVVRARARLRERQGAPVQPRRVWVAWAAAASLALIVLPGPRAVAQQLWNRLVLDRVAVVRVDDENLSEGITAVFTMEAKPYAQESVSDIAGAERLAGFRPSLPPAGTLKGIPKLSVVKRLVLETKPLKTSDIEQALARTGVRDITVPREWEGLTLMAEAGPVVVAEYDDVEVMQSAPFRMNIPMGFQFGRFMEMAFRVFGRRASEASSLGAKFEANPALVLHFPEREPVHDVHLRSGTGIIVGDLSGPDVICFFWNTANRVYIVSATNTSEEKLVALANAIQ
ncbi:MAG TPA: hypothetical protein VJM31_11085 [Vicinamibacterales bacterium]|nr:hypothetical protein [Vicinamibacterales bacterium]